MKLIAQLYDKKAIQKEKPLLSEIFYGQTWFYINFSMPGDAFGHPAAENFKIM